MKEFKCASLGKNCTWKHIARTEELLADVAALHLRDVHGELEVSPDRVGKIKNFFTNPTPIDGARAADLQLKQFNCDLGVGCTWRYIAMTEELISEGVAVHAREAHGVKEFTPAMIARVKNSAHPWEWGLEKKKIA
jgi:predicted small metal-binding protein